MDEYKKSSEIFNSNYVYFSSFSKTWLDHAKSYVDQITKQFSLNAESFVIEVASNDGYLLKNFVKNSIPCLGIEPTHSTAVAAEKIGVPVLEEFFGQELAEKLSHDGKQADLILGNNVYAHVPDINDFTKGLCTILKPDGIVTLEFPHLMQLVDNNQFDTIYHEHFSYLSLTTVKQIFESQGLNVFDVEEITTHGGSLRIYGSRADSNVHASSGRLKTLLNKEKEKGMTSLGYYSGFQDKADQIKRDVVSFLIEQKNLGKNVAAYGAAAKGNTLLNFSGVKKDLISFVVDASPHKQNKFLPGTHIPVLSEEEIRKQKPEYIFILPWNIKTEISENLQYCREWGAKFLTAIPFLNIFE